MMKGWSKPQRHGDTENDQSRESLLAFLIIPDESPSVTLCLCGLDLSF